jgi:hypothetical protein
VIPALERRARRVLCLAAGAALLGLAIPAGVSATTGTRTDKLVKVILTDKGAVWTPALKKLHPNTGVTFKFTILNQASQRHWFAVGTRKTKVLPKGGSEVFFFSFTKVGVLRWATGIGNVRGASFHGAFKVVFPPHFS